MFLKPEAKWLRYREICSCRIVNTATVQSRMGHGHKWSLLGQGHTRPLDPNAALSAWDLILSFAGPLIQFCLFSQS